MLIPRGERLPFGILYYQSRAREPRSALRSVRLSIAYASYIKNMSSFSSSTGRVCCAFNLISPPLRNLNTIVCNFVYYYIHAKILNNAVR